VSHENIDRILQCKRENGKGKSGVEKCTIPRRTKASAWPRPPRDSPTNKINK